MKARLEARISDGLHRPGDRFMSNRAIAERYGISYQTADRLVRELCAEGKLVRRAQSGTYLPGRRPTRVGAQLIFHMRGRRTGSFGARLLAELTARLDRERIAWKITWTDDRRPARLARDYFPVVWESAATIAACIEREHPALLLNQRPPAGLAAIYLESVSTDDHGGGACAAQLLARAARRATAAGPRSRRCAFAILSGPADDPRSNDRVRGFQSVSPATVIASQNWFYEGGCAVAAEAVAAGRDGIFCCNDRLAEAVLDWCARAGMMPPPVVGFDDAPIAERLDLTTIAIPWAEMAAGAAAVIKRRLTDAPLTASRQIFAPRPIVRRL